MAKCYKQQQTHLKIFWACPPKRRSGFLLQSIIASFLAITVFPLQSLTQCQKVKEIFVIQTKEESRHASTPI